MQFHKSLNTLEANISKLQFSTQHDMKPSPSIDDESTFDVVTRTSCNDLFTEEFEKNLVSTIDQIITSSKQTMTSIGTFYQREILDIIIHADRMQNFYFQDNQYKA